MSSRKSQKKNWHQQKWSYLLIALVLLSILGTGIVIHLVHHKSLPRSTTSSNVRPPNSVDYSAATPNDNAANDARKSSPNPADTLDNGPNASTTNNPLGVIILNAQRNGTDVRVGNLVDGTTSGTCTLSATQAGEASPASVQAQVQLDVNNYDCGVMHISVPDTGTWQIKLTVSDGSNSASATTTVGAS